MLKSRGCRKLRFSDRQLQVSDSKINNYECTVDQELIFFVVVILLVGATLFKKVSIVSNRIGVTLAGLFLK